MLGGGVGDGYERVIFVFIVVLRVKKPSEKSYKNDDDIDGKGKY